jgi:hypothetical protein
VRPTRQTLAAFVCLTLTVWALGRTVLVEEASSTPLATSRASTGAALSPTPPVVAPLPPLGPVVRPAPAASPAPTVGASPCVEDVLGALDEDPDLALDARALATLEAALADPTLDLPLRAGALRAALERGGRDAFARAVARFGDADLAPLREHLAHAVARGAGPGDEALVVTLLDLADGARDDDAPRARALATFATVEAARRDEDPVALAPAVVLRVTRALDGLAREGSPDATEALARLATPAALDALDALSRTASDEEARLDAALALTLADAPRGAAAIAALAPTLTDPLLRARLETSCAR